MRYDATLTQGATPSAIAGIRISPRRGHAMDIVSYALEVADNVAAETYLIIHEDAAGDIIAIYDTASLDNQVIYGPRKANHESTVIISTVNAIGKPEGDMVMGNDNLIIICNSTWAQNDLFHIRLRYKLFGDTAGIPIVTAIGTNAEITAEVHQII